MAAYSQAGSGGRALQQLGADRMNKLQGDLFLRTYGGNPSWSSGRGAGAPSRSQSRSSSILGAPNSEVFGGGSASNLRRGGGGPQDVFSATAPPAITLSSKMVEEATGVRLQEAQLEALRGRYKGGSSIPFGAAHDQQVSPDDLRQKVFGSIVLQPGQWPRRSRGDGDGRLSTASSMRSSVRGAGGSSVGVPVRRQSNSVPAPKVPHYAPDTQRHRVGRA
mmetsp:Transcript_33242/g.75738  ORF Transcript_33242/g.75738 Transcript_33242/m.75738 type:complete len:220 (+) Transcript_33242:100-759(+)